MPTIKDMRALWVLRLDNQIDRVIERFIGLFLRYFELRDTANQLSRAAPGELLGLGLDLVECFAVLRIDRREQYHRLMKRSLHFVSQVPIRPPDVDDYF